jgi:predicted DNA-binding protein (UPF0251 family)
MTPTSARLARLRLALRLGEPWALRQLRDSLVDFRGNLQAAASAMGISRATLARLRAEVPAVRAVTDRHAQGHAGAARAAWKVRSARAAERRNGG